MALAKQLDTPDTEGVSGTLAGYIEARIVMRGAAGALHPVDCYTATVYERGSDLGQAPPLATCGHAHRDIVLAEQCLRRLLQRVTKERA